MIVSSTSMTLPLAPLFGNESGCSAADGEPGGGGGCSLGKPN